MLLWQIVISAVLSIFLPQFASAQDDPLGTWTDYTVTDGLPGTSWRSVVVGKDSSIWVGTDAGVARFRDGVWTTYTDTDGLPANNVFSGVVSPVDGTLWVYTDQGICGFDGNEWKQYQHEQRGSALPRGYLAVDNEGKPWAAGGSPWDGNDLVLRLDGTNVTNYADDVVAAFGVNMFDIYGIAVDASGNVWVGGRPVGVCRYDGVSWKKFPFYPICMTRDTQGNVLIGGNGIGRIVGEEYEGLYNTSDWYDVSAVAQEPNGVCWAGAFSNGLYRWDGVSSWKEYMYTNPGNRIWGIYSIAVAPDGSVWCATNMGVSRFQYKNPVAVEERNTYPEVFAVTGNSPNPFNPATTISFTLPAAGPGELAVYSVTGQKVRTLVSQRMAAGAHSALWDGRDDSGKTVSSGVYIARLRAGKTVSSHKMLLMK